MTIIEQLITLGQEIASAGLVQGAGGNLSFREDEQLLVTRSGVWLGRLTPADFLPVALEEPREQLLARDPRPTSEASMHQVAYRARPEARVIIHAHPPNALCLGMLGWGLPAMTPDSYLRLGAHVPLIHYITPTTQALADAIEAEIRRAPALLLQNHGVLVTGRTLDEAWVRLRLLEEQAGIYLQARAISPTGPRIFTPADMAALDEMTGGKYRYS
jgi:ribulose-5-phosphate 4-epimerase/fuculose-1-phosphate aldolase